ncbi:MAG: hypothetical protein EOP00_01065 [Pedobacter sp.]|nr:MAG: hypothetical protein EOP00_01065 [Pedobacter sp.]
MEKAQKNINILFLLLFSAYAIYSIVYRNSSMFFIIYLFWFDELIRSISMYVQVKMRKEDIRVVREFDKHQALGNVKSRFFFLFVYAVFIVVVYGFFFHLVQDDSKPLIRNLQIIMFSDMAFNVCIMIAIVREIIQIRTAALNRYAPILSFGAMSGNLVTLHVSIILGAFMWAITTGKFSSFSFTLGSYNHYAIILPFFIIKFWVDVYNINHAEKGKKSLLETLQK